MNQTGIANTHHKKMNIFSYIYIEGLTNNPSGVSRVIDQLIRYYHKNYPGDKWNFIVNQDSYNDVQDKVGEFWLSNIRFYLTGKRRFQHLKWMVFNKEYFTENIKNNDIVYSPVEMYVPKGCGKSVCTIHDLGVFEPNLFPITPGLLVARLKWRILLKRMELSADAVITVSEFSAGRIKHFFPRLGPKLHVVYNASHKIFGQPISEEANTEFTKVLSGVKYIFKPGGMNFKKNVDLVYKVWPLLTKYYPDLKLVVCGIYKEDKDESIKARNLFGDSFVDLGFISDEFMNAVYQNAEVVWIPSRYEGFGMPAVEAMCCAKPLVVSRAGSLPEVVGDAALICERDSESEHISALSAFLESSDLRNKYSSLSSIRAKKFGWESSAKKLAEIFKYVINKNNN